MEKSKSSVNGKNQYSWIERLLDIPMPDARHRIIGYLLAPYLINVRHIDVNTARRIIEDWVERSEHVYEPPWGNIRAFVQKECQKAYETGKMPKELNHIKEKHEQLYHILVRMAETYGIELE